jgi:hypothetical protein
MRSGWVIALLACGLAACGISAVGQRAEGSSSGDDGGSGGSNATSDSAAGSNDGGTPAPDASSCDGGAGVVFLPSDGASCPSGTVEETVQTNPQAPADACSCGTCTPTANPICNNGSITVSYSDGNSSCNSGTLAYLAVADETCTDFGVGTVTQSAYERWQARTPSGGTCTATPVANQAKATSTPLRRCIANAAESACIEPSTTLRKCIESALPCAGEYPSAVTYGSAATVTCAACGCTRGAAECLVEYFSDGACTNFRYDHPVDGVCARTDDATNVRYFKIRPNGLTCVATPGTPTAALANPKTLCCTP